MQAAERAKDSLAKGLYNKLFEHIVSNINEAINVHSMVQSSENSIGILDIAGFGKRNLKTGIF